MLEGAEILRGGGLVAFPTETVYGLGADATCRQAVDAVFEVKGRPADNPVIVHVADAADVDRIARLEYPRARRLLRRFWPGALTLVLPALEPVRSAACRGLATVAVRMPAHPVALALIRAAGWATAAPSANLSGGPSPTTAEHVFDDLGGRIPLILDGGRCEVGIESTVLDLAGALPVILRPGAVTAEQIASVLGTTVTTGGVAARVRSPGTRYRHYQPRAPIVVIGLDVPAAAVARLVEALCQRLGAGQRIGYVGCRLPGSRAAGLEVLERSGVDSLTRNLYADLRRLDRDGARLILVEAVAAEAPVMERLRRAAAHVPAKSDFEGPGAAELPYRLLSLAGASREES